MNRTPLVCATVAVVPWPSRPCALASGSEESRRQPNRLASRDMEDAESSEKISLQPLDDLEEEPPKKELTWREKVAAFLECTKVQWGIIAFVILDCVIVILELLIDIEIIVIPEDHHEAPNDTSTSNPHTAYNNMHDPVHLSHNVTNNATGLGHEGHGDAEHAPNRHLVEHILHMASLTILSIFFVEVICKIIAEGTHLLKHKAEVFDAIVVVVSFTMDVTFTFVSVTEAARDYAGLLVLLRLWRFTRIINGVILSVKMDADKKIKKEIVLRTKAEQQVQRLTDKCDQLTADNDKLRAKLKRIISNGGTVTTPSERSERSFPVEGMDRTMSERSNLTGLDRTMSERTFSVQPSLDRTMSEKNFTGEGINRSMSDKSNGEASMNDCPSPSDKGVS